IKDTLPAGLTYVNNSINVSTAYTGNLFGDGIVVARVAVSQNIVITYKAKVSDMDGLQCGINKLPNASSATTNEVKTENDTDNNKWVVDVDRKCDCSDPETADNNPDCRNKKSAINNTQDGVDATTVKANGGDVITYTITIVNTEKTNATITVKDILADVLEYATLTDYGGGAFDEKTKTLSWQVILKPGEVTVRNFTITVKKPIPAMAQGQNRPSSYDCVMSNRYGTNVDITVNCPPQKVIERVVKQLPTTGPGENIIFGGIVVAVVVFFYARSRQLGKEVRLVRREFNTGTL
ncbi:MAG: DUF4139 domain-containing protein, partial [Candidatus Nomurabacteria bacterium]|nr:DUF4139 domain-containing protein [Candidatus Nomurabacteria bacterium]